MNFEKLAKELFLKNAALREAFIIEELKPFLIKEGDELIYTHQLRIRLAEIKDFKQRTKETIERVLDHASDCQGVENCDRCWLLQELRL